MIRRETRRDARAERFCREVNAVDAGGWPRWPPRREPGTGGQPADRRQLSMQSPHSPAVLLLAIFAAACAPGVSRGSQGPEQPAPAHAARPLAVVIRVEPVSI